MIDEARISLKKKLSKNNLFNKKTKGFMIPALQFIQKSVLEYCIPHSFCHDKIHIFLGYGLCNLRFI